MSLSSLPPDGLHPILHYLDLDSLVKLYVTFEKRLQRAMSLPSALPHLTISTTGKLPRAPVKYFLANIKSPRNLHFEKDVNWSAFTLPLLSALAPRHLTLNSGFLHSSTYQVGSDYLTGSHDESLATVVSNLRMIYDDDKDNYIAQNMVSERNALIEGRLHNDKLLLDIGAILPSLESLSIQCHLEQVTTYAPRISWELTGEPRGLFSKKMALALLSSLPSSLTSLSFSTHNAIWADHLLTHTLPSSLRLLNLSTNGRDVALYPLFLQCPLLEHVTLDASSVFENIPSSSTDLSASKRETATIFHGTLKYPPTLHYLYLRLMLVPNDLFTPNLRQSGLITFGLVVIGSPHLPELTPPSSIDLNAFLPSTITKLTAGGMIANVKYVGDTIAFRTLPTSVTDLRFETFAFGTAAGGLLAPLHSLKFLEICSYSTSKLPTLLESDTTRRQPRLSLHNVSSSTFPPSLRFLTASLTLPVIGHILTWLPECRIIGSTGVDLWSAENAQFLHREPFLYDCIAPVFDLHRLIMAIDGIFESRAHIQIGLAHEHVVGDPEPAKTLYDATVRVYIDYADFKKEGVKGEEEKTKSFYLPGCVQLSAKKPQLVLAFHEYGPQQVFPNVEAIDVNFVGGWPTDGFSSCLVSLDLHNTHALDPIPWGAFPSTLTRITSNASGYVNNQIPGARLNLKHIYTPSWDYQVSWNMLDSFERDMTALTIGQLFDMCDYYVIPFLKRFSAQTLSIASIGLTVFESGALLPTKGDSVLKVITVDAIKAHMWDYLKKELSKTVEEFLSHDSKVMSSTVPLNDPSSNDSSSDSSSNDHSSNDSASDPSSSDHSSTLLWSKIRLRLVTAISSNQNQVIRFLSLPVWYKGLEEVYVTHGAPWCWLGKLKKESLAISLNGPALGSGTPPHYATRPKDLIPYPIFVKNPNDLPKSTSEDSNGEAEVSTLLLDPTASSTLPQSSTLIPSSNCQLTTVKSIHLRNIRLSLKLFEFPSSISMWPTSLTLLRIESPCSMANYRFMCFPPMLETFYMASGWGVYEAAYSARSEALAFPLAFLPASLKHITIWSNISWQLSMMEQKTTPSHSFPSLISARFHNFDAPIIDTLNKLFNLQRPNIALQLWKSAESVIGPSQPLLNSLFSANRNLNIPINTPVNTNVSFIEPTIIESVESTASINPQTKDTGNVTSPNSSHLSSTKPPHSSMFPLNGAPTSAFGRSSSTKGAFDGSLKSHLGTSPLSPTTAAAAPSSPSRSVVTASSMSPLGEIGPGARRLPLSSPSSLLLLNPSLTKTMVQLFHLMPHHLPLPPQPPARRLFEGLADL